MTKKEQKQLHNQIDEVPKETLAEFFERFKDAGVECKLTPVQAMFTAILGCAVAEVKERGIERVKEDLSEIINIVVDICESEISQDLSRN